MKKSRLWRRAAAKSEHDQTQMRGLARKKKATSRKARKRVQTRKQRRAAVLGCVCVFGMCWAFVRVELSRVQASWVCSECTFAENDSSASACAVCNATCPGLLHALADEPGTKSSKGKEEKAKKEAADKGKAVEKSKDAATSPLMSFMNIELWAHGVLVVRDAVDPTMQRELMADFTERTTGHTYPSASNGLGKKPGPSKHFYHSGGAAKAPACMELAGNVYQQARNGEAAELADAYNIAQICKELRLPDSFKPSQVQALGYGPESTLGFH